MIKKKIISSNLHSITNQKMKVYTLSYNYNNNNNSKYMVGLLYKTTCGIYSYVRLHCLLLPQLAAKSITYLHFTITTAYHAYKCALNALKTLEKK